MKVIASYSKPEEAELAASFLRGSGIEASVRDQLIVGVNWLYSNAVGGVKLEVDEADAERASELLELSREEVGMIRCPRCGSGNVQMRDLSVYNAVLIFVGMVLPIAAKTVDCCDCKAAFSLKEGRDAAGG